MSLSKEIWFSLLLVFVSYLTFFHGLDHYPLWDPDEGRIGIIAKEMVESGNWTTLSHLGDSYYDKPAPYFWLIAIGFSLFGVGELAVRLPSAAAAILTVGIIYLWARRSGGWKWAWWSGLVLATSGEFVALGRFGKMDMVFTLFFTAALLYFLWWKEPSEGKPWIWPFYLFLALASLVKGPAGVVLPLLIVGISLWLQKRWDLVREMFSLLGVGIAVLVSGSWYLTAAMHDPQYIWSFLLDHNLLRFLTVQEDISHPAPVYYLSLILLAGFLPWSFFLPPALHNLWQRRMDKKQEERQTLTVWALAVLVFFSLSRNQLGTYILPALPPLALLTGDFLERLVEGKDNSLWRRRWVFFGSLVWLCLLLVGPPLAEMLLKPRYPQYFTLQLSFMPVSFLLIVTGIAWYLRRERWIPWLISLSALWIILWFYEVKAHEISESRSAWSMAQIVNRVPPSTYRLVATRPESFFFYLAEDIDNLQTTKSVSSIARMLGEALPTVALVKQKHMKELEHVPSSKLFVWKSLPSAGVLVANFPPPSAQDLGTPPKR